MGNLSIISAVHGDFGWILERPLGCKARIQTSVGLLVGRVLENAVHGVIPTVGIRVGPICTDDICPAIGQRNGISCPEDRNASGSKPRDQRTLR